MDARVYDRVTGLSLAVAAVSSILFDRLGSLRWAAGGLAIVSGLVASGVYFYNQVYLSRRRSEAKIGELAAITCAPDSGRLTESHWNEPIAQEPQLRRIYHVPDSFGLFPFEGATKRTHIQQKVARHVGFIMKAVYRSEQRDFVDDVTELIKRLSSSSGEGSYEFVLTRGGSFMIRPVRSLAPRIEETDEYSRADQNLALPFTHKPN